MKSSSPVLENYFMPLLIGVFFIACGKFYFFNIFGIMKEILYLTIGLTVLFTMLKIDYFIKILKNRNVIMLLCYSVILIYFIRFNIDNAILFIIATIIIGFIFLFSQDFFDRTLKFIIVICGFFSLLVLIQAIIYIINPDVINNAPHGLRIASLGSFQTFDIRHPIHYLGFWAGGRENLFGIELPRFHSFAAEPSVLVATSFIPGLLGLTYKGIIRKISYLVLFFTIVLAFAGTIYLSLAVGIFIFFSLLTFRFIMNSRFRFFSAFFILIVYVIAGYSLIILDVFTIMNAMDIGIGQYSDYSSLLGHSSDKAYIRVLSIQDAFRLIVANPFGLRGSTLGGLLMEYGFLMGYIGVLLCGIAYTIIIIQFVRAFYCDLGIVIKIGISLIIGTIIQALFFSSYGWVTPSGLIITSMLLIRSNNLVRNNASNFNLVQRSIL